MKITALKESAQLAGMGAAQALGYIIQRGTFPPVIFTLSSDGDVDANELPANATKETYEQLIDACIKATEASGAAIVLPVTGEEASSIYIRLDDVTDPGAKVFIFIDYTPKRHGRPFILGLPRIKSEAAGLTEEQDDLILDEFRQGIDVDPELSRLWDSVTAS